MNCDDPRYSQFHEYFTRNFDNFGLKKLITTFYLPESSDLFSNDAKSERPYWTVQDLHSVSTGYLEGNDSFDSPECVEYLKQSDIIVTNPPFSRFRDFVSLILEHDKDFLVIGNSNFSTYKIGFPLVRDRKVLIGVNKKGLHFKVPKEYNNNNIVYKDGVKLVGVSTLWFTTLDHGVTPEPLELTKTYYGNEADYPRYDNLDVINVDRVKDIPSDYYGLMGVPISFLSKWNPKQFKILGISKKSFESRYWCKDSYTRDPLLNGKGKFVRIFIKRV